MKDANDIIKKLEQYIDFNDTAEREEIRLYFYILYKWARDRNYNIFFVIRETGQRSLSISIFYKNTSGFVFDLSDEGTAVIDIEIKGRAKDFKKRIQEALTIYLLKMQELDARNDGLDDFLGGDIENDFF